MRDDGQLMEIVLMDLSKAFDVITAPSAISQIQSLRI